MNDPFRHLLAPVDGSKASLQAQDLAIDLARISGRRLTFVHAVNGDATIAHGLCGPYAYDPEPVYAALARHGEAILAGAVARANAAGVKAESRLMPGEPVSATTRAAQDAGATAIVMGTHGRRGLSRAFIGSVTEGVLRGSDIPVLTLNFEARIDAQATYPFRHAVVAVDDSEPARAAVDVAIALAQFNRIALRFVTVLDTHDVFDRAALYGYDPRPISEEMRAGAEPVLAHAARAAQAAGIEFETATIEGHPAEALIAQLRDTDLGIMGSHGRQGLQRLVLGSVAEDLARVAPVPVLVVRRGDAVRATRPALVAAEVPVMAF